MATEVTIIAVPVGQQAKAASLPVTLASDQGSLSVASSPSATVGTSTTHHLISAATTNATSVKASQGTIGLLVVCNAATSKRYFKLYNKASAPTVGTDVPVLTYMLAPGETHEIPTGPYGLNLSAGIAYALTTGITVADTGAVGLSDMSVFLGYT